MLDIEAANKLASDNIGLAHTFAIQNKRVAERYGVEFDDLLSEMMLCLTRCSRNYDPSQSQFSTWSYRSMQLHLLRLLKHQGTGKSRFRRGIREFASDADGNQLIPSGGCDPAFEHIEALDFADAGLAHLPRTEREVLKRRVGNDEPLKKIGESMGLSAERVRQITATAIGKCRRANSAKQKEAPGASIR